jgi:C4-dicarboxylate-specific signal transduction histidine kinase
MNPQWEIIGSEGFKFMGKMNASISHEIKNVLAIINEHAGLLEDFTLMAEKGMPVDPERLKQVAGKIQSQIQRADTIVKNMNTFAHSVDEAKGTVELGGLLSFMAVLTERLATMRGVTISAVASPEPITITTHPFLLQTLIWFCLEAVMENAVTGKKLHLSARADEQGVQVVISGLENTEKLFSSHGFPGRRENALLEALEGNAAVKGEGGEIVLTLPLTFSNPAMAKGEVS